RAIGSSTPFACPARTRTPPIANDSRTGAPPVPQPHGARGPPAEVRARGVDREALPQRLAADEQPEAHLVAARERHLGEHLAAQQLERRADDDPLLLVARRGADEPAV